MKRIVLAIGAAGIAIALAGVAFATSQNDGPGQGRGPGRFGGPGALFGRGGRGPGGPGGPMGALGPMMLGRLDLTSDQKDRVKQILDSHRDEQQALGKRAMAAHDALAAVVTTGTVNEGLIRARAADVAAVEADETVFRARVYSEVLQILTSDQQAKLKTMQTDMQQRRDQMRSNRGQKH